MQRLVALIICLLSVWVTATSGMSIADRKDGARLYFPEQIEYLQLLYQYCGEKEDLILWGDGRCYRESERGPCYTDQVLKFDRQRFRPYCKTVELFT